MASDCSTPPLKKTRSSSPIAPSDDAQRRYRDKIILAPMVRTGSLPFRLLSLRFGAHLVYSEEIIDWKLLTCRRIENERLNTIDFVSDEGTIVFQTCAEERSRVVLQLGTASPERALRAAQLVERDVSAIDINMGCPKEFSLKGGMGAALLRDESNARQILTSLVANLSIPVTCKIRILDDVASTLRFARMTQQAGVAALAVHGRRTEERPRHENHDDYVGEVARHLSIPVIANGGSTTIQSYSDIEAFRLRTGASSVMLAGAAQRNPSIFQEDSNETRDSVIDAFLRLCIRYELCYTAVKFAVQVIYGDVSDELGRRLLGSQSLEEISKHFGLAAEFEQHTSERGDDANDKPLDMVDINRRLVSQGFVEIPYRYLSKGVRSTETPRFKLFEWTRRDERRAAPKYRARAVGKLFYAQVEVQNCIFACSTGHKSKKKSEQAAAHVAFSLLVDDQLAEQLAPM